MSTMCAVTRAMSAAMVDEDKVSEQSEVNKFVLPSELSVSRLEQWQMAELEEEMSEERTLKL